ncbi:hypothetical protein EVAR_78409_1 [Eumeta japonica]|uniref:Uncharacterized protein n=1 Tax=Eumeta variegata TaxID=151549 RepID=A0A4C1T3T7_EUMVA|nr:hypothetical protein EVAR_78409_1 [Eumeta japonica]
MRSQLALRVNSKVGLGTDRHKRQRSGGDVHTARSVIFVSEDLSTLDFRLLLRVIFALLTDLRAFKEVSLQVDNKKIIPLRPIVTIHLVVIRRVITIKISNKWIACAPPSSCFGAGVGGVDKLAKAYLVFAIRALSSPRQYRPAPPHPASFYSQAVV